MRRLATFLSGLAACVPMAPPDVPEVAEGPPAAEVPPGKRVGGGDGEARGLRAWAKITPRFTIPTGAP